MPCLGNIISTKAKTSENSSIIYLFIFFDKNSSKYGKPAWFVLESLQCKHIDE